MIAGGTNYQYNSDADLTDFGKLVVNDSQYGLKATSLQASIYQARIRGYAFNDSNGDGDLDNGENAISGWTAYIDANNNGQLDDNERAVTNGGPTFAFGRLAPGTYTIRVIPPAGDNWSPTLPSGAVKMITVAAGQDFNQPFGFTTSGPAQTPFLGAPFAIAAGTTTIQAEDFDNGGEGVAYHDNDATNLGGAYRNTGVDLKAVQNDTGGYFVGYTNGGEWTEYTINVANSGTYDLGFRVASLNSGGNFHIEIDGANVTSTIAVPNTGGWQTWNTIGKSGVNLAAGQHILRLAFDGIGASGAVGNFNYITVTPAGTVPTQTPFKGVPFNISSGSATRIELEDFDNGGEGVAYHDTDAANLGGAYRNTGVDIQTASNGGSGYDVGWTRAGEYLEYTVNIASVGTFNFNFNVASNGAGGSFHLNLGNGQLTGPVTVPNTGGWQNWQTVTIPNVNLPKGTYVLRLAMDSVGATGAVGNFDYLNITSATTQTTTTLETTTAAYVRDGVYANTNFGSDPQLITKNSTPDYNRESYLKFDLSSVSSISSAKLRLFGGLSDTRAASVPLGVFSVADTSWPESTLTWNNRPVASTQIALMNITSVTPQWWEMDLTSFLQAEKAAGRNIVTMVLKSLSTAVTQLAFNSDDAATNHPQVVISI